MSRERAGRLPDLSVYLVTDRAACLGRDLLEVVEAAVAGGAGVVQLREKSCGTREFVELARAVKRLLAPRGVPLIINDRLDVALAVEAEGVHVGQSDMAVADVRALVGSGMIVGLSVTGEAEVLAARGLAVDYLGIGPVFPTRTKADAGPAMGIEGLRRARELTDLPLIAIGAVGPGNLGDVLAAGADGAAVVSAICSASSPGESARALKRIADAAGRARR